MTTKQIKAAAATKTAAKKSTKKAKVAFKPTSPKQITIVRMISRAKGATLASLVKATGWKANSLYGQLSTLGKSIKIASTKNDAGERVYLHQA
jgi:Protein of unknown function (DUF3489)